MKDKYERYRVLEQYHRYIRASKWLRLSPLFITVLLFFRGLLKFIYLLVGPLLRKIKSEKADIVVLGTCDVDITRSLDIWDILKAKGHSVVFINTGAINLYRNAFQQNVKCDKNVPALIFFHHLLAEFVTQKFRPKMVCLFHSCDVLPSLVRLAAASEVKTIFIPHAVGSSRYDYSSVDFDYYLAFGESTLKNLNHNPVRIGGTKLVKAGSPLFNSPDLPASTLEKKTILFLSTWLVGSDPYFTRDFEIVIEWARMNPAFLVFVKLHPLEEGTFVRKKAAQLKNVQVLSKHIGLAEAIERVSVVVTTASNATIEAASMGRPAVIVNNRPYNPGSSDFLVSDKYLYLEEFFPPRAGNTEELADRINDTYMKYDYYLGRCKEFVKFHLEEAKEATPKITGILTSIYEGREDFNFDNISEQISALKKTEI